MPKNNPNIEQRRRWAKVVELGCLVCGGPAELHHCLHECGMSQRNHDHVAPLCAGHHRDADISRHRNPAGWSDEELHLETIRQLGEPLDNL